MASSAACPGISWTLYYGMLKANRPDSSLVSITLDKGLAGETRFIPPFSTFMHEYYFKRVMVIPCVIFLLLVLL